MASHPRKFQDFKAACIESEQLEIMDINSTAQGPLWERRGGEREGGGGGGSYMENASIPGGQRSRTGCSKARLPSPTPKRAQQAQHAQRGPDQRL